MVLHRPRLALLAVPLLYLLYLFGLTRMGLVGPDEPRYAAIGREMVRSGDWITPKLWGELWFEKPPLLYWMTATAFRLGLNEDLAPRLPVALASVAFISFFYWILQREFGEPAALFGTAVLATSAMWLAFSQIGVPDMLMAATFSAAMLVSLRWLAIGDRTSLPYAAILLGLAVLAKGLVPLILALPLFWMGRRRLLDWFRPRVSGAFLIVAAPWYVLCYVRNGTPFLQEFFWKHHFGRFTTPALQHMQPAWFFLPVMTAALLPWSPLLVLLFRPSWYAEPRRMFLLLWLLFGLAFFSASANKLPGYLLPLIPAAAVLIGISLAENRGRYLIPLAAISLILVAPLMKVMPQALAQGLSRGQVPPFHWSWGVALLPSLLIWYLEKTGRRVGAVLLLTVAVATAVVYIKLESFPVLDREASARTLWRQIEPKRGELCVGDIHRNWRYGLNYYALIPLPACEDQPKPSQVEQKPGSPPFVTSRYRGSATSLPVIKRAPRL